MSETRGNGHHRGHGFQDSFSAGELSARFGLNVQTLHYYDSIGLFTPEKRDAKTGRRRYRFDQVYKLASIRYMRRLGYSLEEIAAYMERREMEFSLEHLQKRSIELKRQWESLLYIDGVIQRKIRFIKNALQEAGDLNAISIRPYPKRYYGLIGGEEKLYMDDGFYFYPTIAFYHGEAKYFGAYLYAAGEQEIKTSMQVHELPEANYLCGYHVGPYEDIPETMHRLRSSHPELTLSDLTVDFNIVDQFVEKDSAKYITHMQIQVLE